MLEDQYYGERETILNGKEGVQNLLCRSRNVNQNLNDINYDKQVNGLTKLREKELACVVNWS